MGKPLCIYHLAEQVRNRRRWVDRHALPQPQSPKVRQVPLEGAARCSSVVFFQGSEVRLENMEFQDKVLKCMDCELEFVFSAGEQLFFSTKNFHNEPKRCKACKAKRVAVLSMPIAAGENFQYLKVQTQATCAGCGRLTTVPFRPSQGRPIFCRECFQRQRNQGDHSQPDHSPSEDSNSSSDDRTGEVEQRIA